MFEPIDKAPVTNQISFIFDGKTISAEPGMNVASALLSAGVTAFRHTPVGGLPRGPFCMMGACYDCLISINDVTVQACLTPVEDGLVVKRVPMLQVGTE